MISDETMTSSLGSKADSFAPVLSRLSNRLRNFHSGGFADFMAEILAQRGRMIGIDARIDAGAGYRNIGEAGVDEVGMYRGIDMDQHAVGGESLGAVAGDRIAMIEVAVIPIGKRDRAAIVEAGGDLSMRRDGLDGGKVPVRYL